MLDKEKNPIACYYKHPLGPRWFQKKPTVFHLFQAGSERRALLLPVDAFLGQGTADSVHV